MARKSGTKMSSSPENIVLHDSAGRVRVMIGVFGSEDCPTFQLNDREGRARVAIQVEPSGRATISILDANGSGLIGLGADPNGRIGFSISRPGGLPALTVGWSEAEGLTTSIWGHSGQPIWQMFEPKPSTGESES